MPVSPASDPPSVDAGTVRSLLAEQFPAWAHLAVVPVVPGGWDNRSFRVGDTLLARLPSGPGYAGQPPKEHRWLPYLGSHLRLPVPRVRGVGRPGTAYPMPWTVLGWLPGRPADEGVPDLAHLADDLAAFLADLWAVPTGDGPPAGAHSAHRGGPLLVWDAETRGAAPRVLGPDQATAALELWEAALATRWSGPDRWLHGDVAPGNLLLHGARLAAVIDWGCCAVGDPACDLAMAWTVLDERTRAHLRARVDVDDGTWLRGAAWALWKSLITLEGRPDRSDVAAAGARRALAALLGPP
jgi:aminoglycoside phosphotransferase (APT) family kinase protein